jgi:hypothetical protein
LLGAALLAQALEEVLPHGGDALGQEEVRLEVTGLLEILEILALDVLAAAGVDGLGGQDLIAAETTPVDGRSEPDDLATRQIAVLLGLDKAIFIGGFAKVLDFVRGDLVLTM